METYCRNTFSNEERQKAQHLLQSFQPGFVSVQGNESSDGLSFYTKLEKSISAQKNTEIDNAQNEMDSSYEAYLNLLTVDVLPTSRVPIVGTFICWTKRFARKWLFWYLKPLLERQSAVNQLFLTHIQKITAENQRLRQELLLQIEEGGFTHERI